MDVLQMAGSHRDAMRCQAPQEVREMEDYVDKLDATHAELQEVLLCKSDCD